MSSQIGDSAARSNTALSAGGQTGGSQALPLLVQIGLEDGRGVWGSHRIAETMGQAARDRRGRARRALHRRAGGTEKAEAGEQNPQTGEGVLKKSGPLLREGGRDSVSSYRLIEAEGTSFPIQLMPHARCFQKVGSAADAGRRSAGLHKSKTRGGSREEELPGHGDRKILAGGP